jgi:hypothetical protein
MKGKESRMKAYEILQPGETAVAIFTRGERFKLKQDGSGSTGNWVISQRRKTDKVIIYKQDTERRQHEIYVGLPVEIIDSDEEGRREVIMRNVKLVGTTSNNWNEFTETKAGNANPVKYIKRK